MRGKMFAIQDGLCKYSKNMLAGCVKTLMYPPESFSYGVNKSEDIIKLNDRSAVTTK
jgi:hypothetical protein